MFILFLIPIIGLSFSPQPTILSKVSVLIYQLYNALSVKKTQEHAEN